MLNNFLLVSYEFLFFVLLFKNINLYKNLQSNKYVMECIIDRSDGNFVNLL